MFTNNKNNNDNTNANALNAILGQGTDFKGTLKFKGIVRLDGVFSGEIRESDHLQIGEHANIKADIKCATILIRGNITGDIEATERATLLKPCKFKGNITTPSLVIEDGAYFDGLCSMTQQDKSIRLKDEKSPHLVSLNQ